MAQNPMLTAPSPSPMLSPAMPNPMLPDPMAPNPMMPGVTDPSSDVPLNPEFGNLPDTPGVEDTYFLCSACHSVQTFAQQSLTDERWDYLWDWMISDQGMPDYGEEARETILAYLKTHFSAER